MLKITDHSITLRASAATTWQKMIDWQHWSAWDGGMQSIKFDGPLALGSKGLLKLKDGPQVTLRVTEFNSEHSYTSAFDLLGTSFIFGHDVCALPEGGSRMHFSVDAGGPTAFFLGNLVKARLIARLPAWMSVFKALVDA